MFLPLTAQCVQLLRARPVTSRGEVMLGVQASAFVLLAGIIMRLKCLAMPVLLALAAAALAPQRTPHVRTGSLCTCLLTMCAETKDIRMAAPATPEYRFCDCSWYGACMHALKTHNACLPGTALSAGVEMRRQVSRAGEYDNPSLLQMVSDIITVPLSASRGVVDRVCAHAQGGQCRDRAHGADGHPLCHC